MASVLSAQCVANMNESFMDKMISQVRQHIAQRLLYASSFLPISLMKKIRSEIIRSH